METREARRAEALEMAKRNGWIEAPAEGEYLCYGYWTDIYCGKVLEKSKARMTIQDIETVYYRDDNGNVLEQWYFINPSRTEKFSLRKNGRWMKIGISDMWSRVQDKPYTYYDWSF